MPIRPTDSLVWCTLALAAVAGGGTAAAGSACEPQPVAQVELQIPPSGIVYLPATVAGREVYFQLSIGSGLPMILEPAVGELGLKPRPMNGTGTFSSGGRRVTTFAKLEDLRIGDARLLTRAAPILPAPDGESLRLLDGKPIVGVMGATLFRNLDAELHLAERRLTLFKPFKCRSQSPVYWGGEYAELPLRFDRAGTLVFTLELNGRKIESSLIGSGGTSAIDINVARQFFGVDETSPGSEVTAGPGESPDIFHAMSVAGRGLDIRDARIRLRPGNTCKLTGSTHVYGAIGYQSECLNLVPFALGTDLLMQMRIYISHEREKVYVSQIVPGPADQSATIRVGADAFALGGEGT